MGLHEREDSGDEREREEEGPSAHRRARSPPLTGGRRHHAGLNAPMERCCSLAAKAISSAAEIEDRTSRQKKR